VRCRVSPIQVKQRLIVVGGDCDAVEGAQIDLATEFSDIQYHKVAELARMLLRVKAAKANRNILGCRGRTRLLGLGRLTVHFNFFHGVFATFCGMEVLLKQHSMRRLAARSALRVLSATFPPPLRSRVGYPRCPADIT
jgi:DNA-binding GntR family transcriptional regulator